MLPVPHELNPGIDDARTVAVITPESALWNTNVVPVPSGVEGSPMESEITPNEAGFLPQVEANSMRKEVTLRKSFSVKEKCECIVAIDALIETGASCCQAFRRRGAVQPGQGRVGGTQGLSGPAGE